MFKSKKLKEYVFKIDISKLKEDANVSNVRISSFNKCKHSFSFS
jgi:hypothetical protein